MWTCRDPGGHLGVLWGPWGLPLPQQRSGQLYSPRSALAKTVVPVGKVFWQRCISNWGGWRAGVSQRSRRASPWANAAPRPCCLAFRLAFLSHVLPW